MKLNDTLISIRLVSEDTRKAVNDTFSSGAQEIEYFKYSAEVNNISFRIFISKHPSPIGCAYLLEGALWEHGIGVDEVRGI